MRRAIRFHVDGLREDGQPIPHPSTVAATVITLDAAQAIRTLPAGADNFGHDAPRDVRLRR
jgi:hypothetical protein